LLRQQPRQRAAVLVRLCQVGPSLAHTLGAVPGRTPPGGHSVLVWHDPKIAQPAPLVRWFCVRSNGITQSTGSFTKDGKILVAVKGGAEEIFEPHFTWQGFRYLKIEGYPGEIKPENFEAVALYSDMEPTGTFTSSNPLINQLQHNIQWGQRGNFLDVPTDCPQRDERLGWTGDAQAFSRTASFNFGVNNFFAKWLRDVEADQLPSGSVPFVVPNVLGPGAGAATGWADAATIIPWNMWLAYGDKKILEDQYESMKAWVGFMEKNSTNYLWNKGFHFGDWLFYRPFDDNDGNSAVTDKYLIAQCFFAHSTDLLIKTARVLGKEDDVVKIDQVVSEKSSWTRFLPPTGKVCGCNFYTEVGRTFVQKC
jgi:alpha-L-rhamnosidase